MAWNMERVGNFNLRSIAAAEKKRASKRQKQQAKHAAQMREAERNGVKVQQIPYRQSAGTQPTKPVRDEYVAQLEHQVARLQAFNAALLAGKSKDFYNSDAWFRVRYEVLKRANGCCELCGQSKADGAIIQVDHIKPRSLYPELELDPNNMQVLCKPCNLGKSNKDSSDWRKPALKVVRGN